MALPSTVKLRGESRDQKVPKGQQSKTQDFLEVALMCNF